MFRESARQYFREYNGSQLSCYLLRIQFLSCCPTTNPWQLEVSSRIHHSHPMQYDVSVLDPEGHLDAADSKNYDCAEPIASAKEFISMNPVSAPVSDAAFRISIPEGKEQKDRWLGRPIIEYTCRDKFRPVPMVRCQCILSEACVMASFVLSFPILAHCPPAHKYQDEGIERTLPNHVSITRQSSK